MRYFFTALLSILLAVYPYMEVLGGKPYVTNFDRETYLAANKNWDIAQDREGILYFGNDNGLLEFDGISWQLYSLPGGDLVRAVAVSRSGDIFTGGYEEFGVWKRGVSGSLSYNSISAGMDADILRNDDVWRIIVSDTAAYFQSFSKIYRYSFGNGGITTISPQWGGILFLMDIDGGLFVQRMKGAVLSVEANSLIEVTGTDMFSNTDVMFVLPYGRGGRLVGTSDRGIYIREPGGGYKTWDCEFSARARSGGLNRGILRRNGNYVFGTILSGVYEVDPQGNVVNHFSTDNFLNNNTSLALLEDSEDNLWVASDRGISYIRYMPGIGCYTDPVGRTGAVYTAALYEGQLFIGTNQGVYRMPWDRIYSQNPLSWLRILPGTEGQVWDLVEIDGRLLCGHNSGLKIIDRNFNVTSAPEPRTGVYDIKTASNLGADYILLGTYNSIAAVTPVFKPLAVVDDIREPVSRVELDDLGNIWLGHPYGGIYRYRFSADGQSIAFNGDYSGNAVGQDNLPSAMKLMRVGGRVIFYDGAMFYAYNDIDDRIVLFDKLNQCFSGITSLKKIIRLSGDEFLALGDKAAFRFMYDGNNASMLNKVDIGFSQLALVNRFENLVRLDDSLSLICLDNGFLLLDNERFSIAASSVQYPVLRYAVAMNSSQQPVYMDVSRQAVIPYKRNSLRFGFSATNAFNRNVLFQYKIEGMEGGCSWSAPSKSTVAMFDRLPKGNYAFLLRTTDNLGNASEPVSFSFRVKPVWYANGWAYLGYIVLASGVVLIAWSFMLRRYRNAHLIKVRMREEQRLRRHNYHLQKEIEERNAELFRQTSSIIRRNELIQEIKNEIDRQYRAYSDRKTLKPLYDRISGLLQENMDAEEDWKMFLMNFERHHKDFFHNMKVLNPDLTPSDLKMCACLRLNLSSKEIASLMNVSLRAVENSRYRLRKKLDISPNRNINDFLMEI